MLIIICCQHISAKDLILFHLVMDGTRPEGEWQWQYDQEPDVLDVDLSLNDEECQGEDQWDEESEIDQFDAPCLFFLLIHLMIWRRV